MDAFLVGLLSFVAIIVLILLGLHVGTALFIVAFGGLVIMKGIAVTLNTLQYIPFVSVANYNFAVFPLFILMGELISASGITTMLFDSAQAWLGRLKGGLGMAVCAMGAALGAITGAAIASSAMMARTAFPQMLRHKYDPAAAAGLIAGIGPLAVLIPPSVFLALYGVMTEESISELLMAGFLPGFLSAAIYMGLIYILALRSPQKFPLADLHYTWRERIAASRNIAPILLVMLIMLGGLYLGVFTPSEAGAVGAIVSLVIVIIFKRRKATQASLSAVWESAGVTSMMFFVVMAALLYGRFMTTTGATKEIIGFVADLEMSRYIIFALLMVIYLLLGCFLDSFSMMATTLPITHPLMIELGFDPIWFGVVIVVMVEAGAITPPYGIVVFSVKALIGDQAELWAIFMNALPFVAAMMVVVLLLTIWPQIALFLPSMMGS